MTLPRHMAGTLVAGTLVLALAIAGAGPALAATASKVSGSNQIRLDPEKGDVRASLNAVAAAIGAKVSGDSPLLATPAPNSPIVGTPERLLKRLLRDQDYVLKTDESGRILEVVILSGSRGRDPAPGSSTPPATMASAASPPAGPPPGAPAVGQIFQATPTYGAAEQQAKAFARGNVPEQAPERSLPPSAMNNLPAAPPVTITPEMQAQIAEATKKARGDLQVLVDQLKAACPAGQKC